MHSVQKELSRHFYIQVKCKLTRTLGIQVMQRGVNFLVLAPQCSREFGSSVGRSHLARQLGSLPELVPETSAGV